MQNTINGNLARRVSVDTNQLEWTASPSGTVFRKRVHLVGAAEAGQVTSVVRYAPHSNFPSHEHPDGEEILVLDGIFSDEHGDWPQGTFLLNPEGFQHAPFSEEGCVLFVKLRQYPGEGRARVALDTKSLPWEPTGQAEVATKQLYRQPGFEDRTVLERWDPGAAPGIISYPDGAELFVIEGSFTDEHGDHGPESWSRFPIGSAHTPRTASGCEIYIKEGGLVYLETVTA